jgi:hypothetical protein
MKDKEKKEEKIVSYCGICCSLCPPYRSKDCPGCFELKDCKILQCAEEKNIRYCFFCEKFPCKLYEEGFDWDLNSFSTLVEFSPGVVKWKPYSKEYIYMFKMLNKRKKDKNK